MVSVKIREIPGWGGKYYLDASGRVWRRDVRNRVLPVATTGNPPRVRLYRNGKETRPYVHRLFQQVFGEPSTCEHPRVLQRLMGTDEEE